MNKRIKDKWIEALRSGKYKYGMGKLKSVNNEFCCLGVLCDILMEELNIKWRLSKECNNNSYSIYGKYTVLLPTDILDYCELDSEDMFTLMQFNDNGYPFSYISEWVEERL